MDQRDLIWAYDLSDSRGLGEAVKDPRPQKVDKISDYLVRFNDATPNSGDSSGVHKSTKTDTTCQRARFAGPAAPASYLRRSYGENCTASPTNMV